MQAFLESGTKNSVNAIYEMTLNSESANLFNLDLFFNSSSFDTNLIGKSPLLNLSEGLINELHFLSSPKNDALEMLNIFPQYRSEIEVFEILSCNIDNSLYENLSTPDFKLYYPEPFIASPSFVHEDLWFIHILHYQHWLWFMFISLIMFFFITFINVVRWCNPRNKPRKETRGVSRSKCADLITACVPVSWATSIIISESVDASDYYDGFGTGEIVVGIRAYQWGWEYFYPKGIDLNYNVSPSYSTLVGNSVKYSNASGQTSASNTFWKNLQKNTNNHLSSTPAHLILSPTDNNKLLNFINFNNIGLSSIDTSTAFKKIQFFSKTNPQELFNNVSDFQLKYTKLSSLYQNDSNLLNSSTYGTFRQHNYNSNASLTNNFVTCLDAPSVNKFLDYNYGLNKSSNLDLSQVEGYNRSETDAELNLNLTNLTGTPSQPDSSFPANLTLLSSEVDNKQFSNPFKYALNEKWDKKTFIGSSSVSDWSNLDGIKTLSNDLLNKDSIGNKSLTYRFKDLKSASLQSLPADRNTRLMDNLNLTKSNLNYDGAQSNTESITNSGVAKELGNSQINLFNQSNSLWSKTEVLNRTSSTKTFSPTTNLPGTLTNPLVSMKSFDKFNSDGSSAPLLRSKEESAPSYVFDTYWSTYWASSDNSNRLENINSIDYFAENLYLPTFTEYSEYDFRNWQSLELLEDSFWESTYSSYTHEDYVNTLQTISDYSFFKKQEEIFNTTNRAHSFKQNTLSKPFLKDTSVLSNINSLPIFSEDAVPNTNLTSLKNFKSFGFEPTVDAIDDSYESFKYLNYLHHLNYLTTLNFNTSYVQPLAYSQVLNMFRPDYDENSWSIDSALSNNLEFENDLDLQLSNDLRFSNPLKLRSTTKNAMVTYSAIQKVFKSRFDEGRSNARLQDVSNSYNNYLFISEKRSPYESLLAKNKESFFSVNNYNQTLSPNFNDIMSVWNTLNIYYIDLPFLTAEQSDSARHLWFDWQSRWSSIEVQPSSVARYSLLGVPYSTKNFEYSTQAGDELNDSETYLIKLAKARKNYLSNWSFTPYFYARTANWYSTNASSALLYNTNSVESLRLSLEFSKSYWLDSEMVSTGSLSSTPSFSGVNTPGRASWKPDTLRSGQYYNASALVDLLSKREYLYREYFLNRGYSVNLPKYLLAVPNNPLLEEVKNSYAFIDPSSFGTEVSREFFYQNTSFLKFNLLKDFLLITNNQLTNSGLNLSWVSNYLFYYLLGSDKNTSLGSNLDFYKNQYRPMKKGVSNMIRLHATGAIAMPIEIRMHILASSKDVIHSWAIPSAGIKIDCVPGYSSHRVAIFLLSGIFWGQCMEICGRFHHWMPIIVYFMKRDLFFLWCTHFMHYSSLDNTFNMTDKQLTDHLRLVSFDKSSWIKELNNIL